MKSIALTFLLTILLSYNSMMVIRPSNNLQHSNKPELHLDSFLSEVSIPDSLVFPDRKAEERKLVDVSNMTTSNLLGDAERGQSSNMRMLLKEQQELQNSKQASAWISDVEERLKDLEKDITNKLSDFAIGLQRKNNLMGHYNAVGQGFGAPYDSMFMQDPYYHNK